MLNQGDIVEVEIETLASTGKGVSHIENDSVFVELAVPGDVLKVEIVKGKKSFYEAKIVEIIKESPTRVKPICPHFGKCGACDWLHIDYDSQVLEKKKMLEFYFKRNRVELPEIEVISADDPLYYRQKIRLKNGFYARNSNKPVAVSECHIIDKTFWPLLSVKRDYEECFGIDSQTKKYTQDLANYSVGDVNLLYHPKGFVQSNLKMNEKLVASVLDEVCGDKVLDLYCGNGNFSIPLSKKVKKVVAVEGAVNGYNLLNENIKNNEIHNVDPYLEDVKVFAKKWGKYDCVILDPPRTGSDEVLGKLPKLADRIIYVSCDASVLAKEAKQLLEDFNITKVKLIDMFPQTRHFETILVLEKK